MITDKWSKEVGFWCSWVAHPALVTIAKEIFDEHMKSPNQIHVAREDVQKGAADLLQVLLRFLSFKSPSSTLIKIYLPRQTCSLILG